MTATILNYDALRPWVVVFLVAYAAISLFIKGRLWYYRWQGSRLERDLSARD